MRDLLSESNLRKALGLSALATAASVPRILHGGLNPWFYVPAAFVSLTLIAGMASAWDRRAGLAGLWPDPRRRWGGAVVAALAGLALVPVALKLDPAVRAAFAGGSNPTTLALQYPGSAAGVLALILWSAGFELLFFVAAPAAFFGRLLNRKWIAIAGPVVLRVVVAHHQLVNGNITGAVPLILTATGVFSGIACLLFAQFGLVAPAVFVAIIEARLLL